MISLSQLWKDLKPYIVGLIGDMGGGGGHVRLHLITSTSDHSSTATPGQMLKADANGLPVNATNTDAQVADTVAKSQTAIVSATEPATTKVGLIWVDIS